MFLALATPVWIDHPVTRHVIGRRGDGRWSRRTGLLPIARWSIAPVAVFLIVREVWFPRASYSPWASALTGAIVLLPLLLAAMTAAWQGSAGLASLNRDPAWRDLVASGVPGRELIDGMCVGLALRAVIAPLLLFQAIVVYFALDGTLFGSTGRGLFDLTGAAFFRWLFAATIFLVAAGPMLDYALLGALAQTAAGRGTTAAMLHGAWHFLLAVVALIVGLGVFGVMFLVIRAEALRKTCHESLLRIVQEAA